MKASQNTDNLLTGSICLGPAPIMQTTREVVLFSVLLDLESNRLSTYLVSGMTNKSGSLHERTCLHLSEQTTKKHVLAKPKLKISSWHTYWKIHRALGVILGLTHTCIGTFHNRTMKRKAEVIQIGSRGLLKVRGVYHVKLKGRPRSVQWSHIWWGHCTNFIFCALQKRLVITGNV